MRSDPLWPHKLPPLPPPDKDDMVYPPHRPRRLDPVVIESAVVLVAYVFGALSAIAVFQIVANWR